MTYVLVVILALLLSVSIKSVVPLLVSFSQIFLSVVA